MSSSLISIREPIPVPKAKKLTKGEQKIRARFERHVRGFHELTKDFDLGEDFHRVRYEELLKEYNAKWVNYCNSYITLKIGKCPPNPKLFYNALIKPYQKNGD